MYNMNRKLIEVKKNYLKLRDELENSLKEAITSDRDINIIMGYTSKFKPLIFNLYVKNMSLSGYYDDIIYTVRNNGLCLMQWFDNDLSVIGEIIGSTYKEMKEYTSEVMEKPYMDVSYDDVLIALDTDVVNNKLLHERKRIILETYDFKRMAERILDTYMDFLEVNYNKEEE